MRLALRTRSMSFEVGTEVSLRDGGAVADDLALQGGCGITYSEQFWHCGILGKQSRYRKKCVTCAHRVDDAIGECRYAQSPGCDGSVTPERYHDLGGDAGKFLQTFLDGAIPVLSCQPR